MCEDSSNLIHVSVLLKEVVEGLALERWPDESELDEEGGLWVLDCTLGAAGHSRAILQVRADINLVGVDKDDVAIELASKSLEEFSSRVSIVKADFLEVGRLAERNEFGASGNFGKKYNAILADLGVSSMQLDDNERGFSFRSDSQLDMRMDRELELTADYVVNQYSERELCDVFRKGGLGKDSRPLARFIVGRRPIEGTADFARVSREFLGHPARGKPKKNPESVAFQAVRIEVNGEFSALNSLLDSIPQMLCDGGRFAAICFHSLEDKFVAKKMRGWEQGDELPVEFPRAEDRNSLGKVITKKAILPTDFEIKANPRARSARLRIFERRM